MSIDPAWVLCGVALMIVAALTIAAWKANLRGELPPLDPDNSIVHGRGDWSKEEEDEE